MASIVEAARRRFDRDGYENTRVDDILADLGLSKGGFYHYFHGKADILFEMIRRCILRILEEGRQAIGSSADLPTAVQTLAAIHQKCKQTDLACLAGIRDPTTRMAMEVHFRAKLGDQYAGLLATLIERGNALGELRVEHPHATAKVLLALYFAAATASDESTRQVASQVAAQALGLTGSIDLMAFQAAPPEPGESR